MKTKWSQESLRKGIEAVHNGMGKRKAAQTFGIPWGTFSDKLSGRRKLDGPAAHTVLTMAEEEEIINFLKSSARRGFGKTKDELLLTVQSMLNCRGRKTNWKDNLPGEKWFRLFKKRFPEMVFRTPQRLGKQRAMEKILKWFDDFSEYIKSSDPTLFLEPARIYNCNESGFSLDASTGKVMSSTGTRFVYQVGCEQRLTITVLACCSASGHFVWPVLIHQGKVGLFQNRGFQSNDLFPDAFVTRSKNGWTNQDIFQEWLEKVFVPQTKSVKKPILLLVDGHSNHVSMPAEEICIENHIIVYALPPHTSHVMQPLDVTVFPAMRSEWRKAVGQENPVDIVTKHSFARIFKLAYEKTVSRDLAAQAFRTSGLYPLDPRNINWEKVKVLPRLEPGPAGDKPTEHLHTNLAPLTPSTSGDTDFITVAPVDHIEISAVKSTLPVNEPSDLTVNEQSNSPVDDPSDLTVDLPVDTPSVLPVIEPSDSPVDEPSDSPVSARPVIEISTTISQSDGVSTLRQYSMLCARIGEDTLAKYFERLEEGCDCTDPVFDLWKSYHQNILVNAPHQNILVNHPQESTGCPSRIKKDPLAIQRVPKGRNTKRRKVQQ